MFRQILIIDPTPADSCILRDILKRLYPETKIIIAGRTSIALEEITEFQKKNKPFDLLILDIDQPDGDDITPIRRLLKDNSTIPLLVLADDIDPLVFFKAYDAGAIEYIPKPLLYKSEQDLVNIFQLVSDRFNRLTLKLEPI